MNYKKVYICSPFKGKTGKVEEVVRNIRAAQEYCRELVRRQPDMIPVAPHLYFTQFLDDDDPKQREAGLAMGRALLAECEAVLVFGEYVSKGMQAEIEEAIQRGIIIYNGYAALLGKGLVPVETGFEEPADSKTAPEDSEKQRCGMNPSIWL